ncbi:cysteinyl leukotriene receptor 1-like isoform X2 [Lineus longissimus]|uniref:cysteinyl leukotriene receptor 1-like isoform X2 n=1 Tax=Lineus longissimus TaxID=88925 RepID=UPI002B4F8907
MAAVATADSLVLFSAVCCRTVTSWIVGESVGEFPLQCCWYSVYTFGTLSGLSLAQMSIDRLIAVRFPLRAIQLCTTGRTKRTVAITYTTIITLNLHVFFVYKKEGPLMLNVVIPGHHVLQTLVLQYHLFIGTVLPFAVIVVCNIWIIVTLKNSAKWRKQTNKTTVNNGGQKSRETSHLTRMLVTVCVAYVVTTIPYRLYVVFMEGVPELVDLYDMNETYWNLRYTAQYWLFSNLWVSNYGINFYLYCVGGGSKYRNDVKKMVKKLLRLNK